MRSSVWSNENFRRVYNEIWCHYTAATVFCLSPRCACVGHSDSIMTSRPYEHLQARLRARNYFTFHYECEWDWKCLPFTGFVRRSSIMPLWGWKSKKEDEPAEEEIIPSEDEPPKKAIITMVPLVNRGKWRILFYSIAHREDRTDPLILWEYKVATRKLVNLACLQ